MNATTAQRQHIGTIDQQEGTTMNEQLRDAWAQLDYALIALNEPRTTDANALDCIESAMNTIDNLTREPDDAGTIEALAMTAWDMIELTKGRLTTKITFSEEYGSRVTIFRHGFGRIYFSEVVPGSRLEVLLFAIHEGDKALAQEAKRKLRTPAGMKHSDRLGSVSIPKD